ncbi:putative selenate ABC transporter substrate-binding protein [Coleofasciculus sp. FACHB-1120]|uniref:putative selenate ABC transporter substrate-binding protein n=1 Tax=Coleofasciculus sp. FACHB-1120 TaxID=2692783 RepID=UPI001686FA8D|nr:putative selenate ABC transporter substrate-binding protein [Coleofasciculus sp. FACHB-1120]MBD2742384.1 putative selenate ABC transporter substrate-binding protein [Coleofasciculus sp. FACHB-1120]
MKKILLSGLLLLLPLAACSPNPSGTSATNGGTEAKPLTIGAIPDQDPQKLQRQYDKLAAYLEKELGVPVEYKPVTDYTAAVTVFKVGDLDLVWFGGLTGVQARLQVPGAEAIAQRDIDAQFHSLFIANKKAGLKPFKDISGLQQLKAHSFTFGSESSTSGRLMPQYFLQQAGLKLEDLKGQAGFSGDHDKTIKLVEAGTYDVGAVNESVWKKRVEAKEVDLNKVEVLWETPAYYDYHWVMHPDVKQRYGEDFVKKVQNAFLKLDPKVPEQKEILDLLQATKFIPTQNSNYAQIEEIGRKIGKIK